MFDVSLELKENESVLLVGSNGSGKSTLFKAIFGLLDIWEGSVEFENQILHTPKLKAPTSKLIQKD
ncbi:MAG: ATP-binding cassette domain-containing protein [Candidatus Parvibacillus calidus]|nr:MAG: ATP-binding cassette domain-containing protein [Candidatus Parvibacillus calidus]